MSARRFSLMRCVAIFVAFPVSFCVKASSPGVSLFPALKPGLWEIVNSRSYNPGFTTTGRRCVGPASQERLAANKEFMEASKDCRTVVSETSAKKINFSMECKKIEGVTITTKISFDGSFSSRFEQLMTISLSIPSHLEGASEKSMYRFVGTCPKNMKPGDTVTSYSDGSSSPVWNRYSNRGLGNDTQTNTGAKQQLGSNKSGG
jgi:hypothetical protein